MSTEKIVTERSTEEGNYYGDIVDGSLYTGIIESRGGEEAAKYDVFLSLSTDGFQTFGNKSYDTWSIIALLHNLPPSCRFFMKNIIHFSFVKGRYENITLDTYFRPLVDEISELNAYGGTMFELYDGEKRGVMVHIVWIGGDSPAVPEVGGLKGVNGVSPCRFCDILGH